MNRDSGYRSLRVGLVTCAELPEPDHDEAPTVAAFAAAGHRAEPIAWNGDCATDLSRFDVCLIRATWDYFLEIDRFLAWIDAASAETLLLNTPDVVRWNCHKRYLRELALWGVSTVPTLVVPRGESVAIARIAEERGWTRGVMVKPAIGAGSWNAKQFAPKDLQDAQSFIDGLKRDRDVILQPLVPGFFEPGERSLIWIDGRWTHAIRKHPRFAGQDEAVTSDGLVNDEERAVGDRVLGKVGGNLLYARLDVVAGDPETGGPGETPLVSELELIEPSLFFFLDDSGVAAQALVAGTERAIRRFRSR